MLDKVFSWLGNKIALAGTVSKSSPAIALRHRQQDKYIDARPVNIEAETRATIVDSSVATAIVRVSDALNTLPLKVYTVDDSSGEQELIPAEDHPITKLFDTPLPPVCKMTMTDMINHWVQCLIGAGNSYHAIEKADWPNRTTEQELWPLEPFRVKIKQDAKGLPNIYEYEVNGQKVQYAPDKILHIKLYEVSTPLYGRSRLTSINPEIMTAYYAKRVNRKFFEQGAQIGGILSPDNGADLTPEQHEVLADSWRKRYVGWENAHKTAIMPLDVKYQDTTPSMRDMQFKEMLEYNRETALGTLGVTPIFAGVLRYTNYSTSITQEKLFWTMAVLPIARLIESAINNQLINVYYGGGHVVKFDTSKVEALQPDRAILAATEQIYVNSGIRTINEIRAEHGWEPVPWGDEQPQKPSPFGMPQDEEDDDEEDKKPGDKRVSAYRIAIRGRDDRRIVRLWKDHDDFVSQKERRFYTKLRSFFTGQYGRVSENLDRYTVGGRMFHSAIKALAISKYTDTELMAIFNMMQENELFEKFVKGEYKKIMREAGQRSVQMYGLSSAFELSDPAVLAEIERLVNRIDYVNETTWNNLKDIFSEGVEAGSSREDIVKEIKDLFGDMKTSGARRIAQTEMNGVINGGTWQSWAQNDVPGKKWSATLNNTRDSHLDLHGQTIRIDEPFVTMLGSAMMHPGDPAGVAGDVINCHCGMVPVEKVEN